MLRTIPSTGSRWISTTSRWRSGSSRSNLWRHAAGVATGAGRARAVQERRSKEILSANLDGSVPLKDVARECRLSVSHFSRAFRRTMGVAPHNWLLARRIEVAKEKLRDRRLSLSDVALVCGFADQSHLTRVFTGMVGVSPGAWRRALDE